VSQEPRVAAQRTSAEVLQYHVDYLCRYCGKVKQDTRSKVNEYLSNQSSLSLIASNSTAARAGSWELASLSFRRPEDGPEDSRFFVARSNKDKTVSMMLGLLVHDLIIGRSIP